MKPKIISWIASLIIRLFNWTVRVQTIEIPPATNQLMEKGGWFILALWHNQILSVTYHGSVYLQKKRKLKLTPLVSHSKDGEYIYETFLRFGMESVRGSSSKGGVSGFRALLKTLKDGRVPVFTPDGPRGPLYKLQEGVVHIAQLTELPIVYFHSIYDRYYEFKSWDKHRFPKLFAKQWIVYSEPYYVPKDANLEEKCIELEQLMLEQVKLLEKIREEKKQ